LTNTEYFRAKNSHRSTMTSQAVQPPRIED
jgi:hypothetical protein